MSKGGRQRRTAQQRLADRENRSALMYLKHLAQQVQHEQLQKAVDEETVVSETDQ